MPADNNETALLALAKTGDEDALSRLLVLNHDRLVDAIRPKIPPKLAGAISAEDIVQETFVITFRRIDKLELTPNATFFHWLAGIASNVLRDAVKAGRTAKRGGDRARIDSPAVGPDQEMIGLLEMLAAHSHTPSRSAARNEGAAAVGAALDELPEDYQHALRLRYLEALPVADIAARLGKSEGAVHQLCHRGLRALRDVLGASSNYFSAGG